jgi:hypothetical protein
VTQNSGGTNAVKPLKPLKLNKLSDAEQSGVLWQSKPNKIESVVTVAPTHEPFLRATNESAFNNTSPGIQPGATFSGPVDATKLSNVTQAAVTKTATDKDLRNQPPADCAIGSLTKDQVTGYFAQIGKTESGGDYRAVNTLGFTGKYQFGYAALIDCGYVKSNVTSNKALSNPNSWKGTNGIDSLEDWLSNQTEQEKAMCTYTKRNYSTCCKIGAITQDQTPEDVAGMLAVAHLLGPGAALEFRKGKVAADAYGTTGAQYFNNGKYAVAVLAPRLAQVNAG